MHDRHVKTALLTQQKADLDASCARNMTTMKAGLQASHERRMRTLDTQWVSRHNAALQHWDAYHEQEIQQLNAQWSEKLKTAQNNWGLLNQALKARSEAAEEKWSGDNIRHTSALDKLKEDYSRLFLQFTNLQQKQHKSNDIITSLTEENQHLKESAQEALVAALPQVTDRQTLSVYHSNFRLRSLVSYWSNLVLELEQERDTTWVRNLGSTNRQLLASNERLTRSLCESEMAIQSLRRQVFLLKHLQDTASEPTPRVIEL